LWEHYRCIGKAPPKGGRCQRGGRFAEAGVAWLNWRLKGDEQAAKMFEGPDCGLCKDPVWRASKKGML